ncbi:unnamed protein product, partial [Cylicostephanus goldi]
SLKLLFEERERKEKEAAKKAAAAQRRRFKKLAESAGHWTDDPRKKLAEMERLCLSLPVEAMSSLCDSIEKLSVREEILATISEAEAARKNDAEAKVDAKGADKHKEEKAAVCLPVTVLCFAFFEASNTYPAGTVDRWNVIADYINEHRKDKSMPPKNEKQVIKQCKAVQSMNVKLPATTQNTLGASLPDEDTWTVSEQKLLEQAIKTYPASDPERWEKVNSEVFYWFSTGRIGRPFYLVLPMSGHPLRLRNIAVYYCSNSSFLQISTAVGTKTKKACIRRFKYLVQLVKSKKEEGS